MTNAAGTENRFPRTVMEAVLGLNSYLQNQFSSLADIYMPIEGIHESKLSQEFIYRVTPNTIKANTLTLDRIKGKTLVWNQLVQNGDFNGNIDNWSAFENCSMAYGDNSAIVTVNSDGYGYSRGIYQNIATPVLGHKYLIAYSVKCSSDGKFGVEYGNLTCPEITVLANTVARFGGIIEMGQGMSGSTLCVNPVLATLTAGTTYEIANVICIDLTLMFDAGNEPSTVAEFESMFPGYHDYEPGKLISNDAESIETVGFNQWDEEWENGTFNTTTGENISNSIADNQIRSKNLIHVLPNTEYYLKAKSDTQGCWCMFLDANKNVIYAGNIAGQGYDGNSFYIKNHTFTTPGDAAYMKFYCVSEYGSSYTNDICINLSDSSRNGVYEPFKKVVIGIRLNSVKVYSPNIWDEVWENGTFDTTTGANVSSDQQIRAKNKIPCMPGVSYCFHRGTAINDSMWVIFYDGSENVIENPQTSGQLGRNGNSVLIGGDNVVRVPYDAYFMRFYCTNNYGATYNNDICINSSAQGFNGKYFPYGELTYNGLGGAGTAYDEIAGGKYTRRVKRVNLGDLTWTMENGVFYAEIPDRDHSYIMGNGVCSKYPITSESLVARPVANSFSFAPIHSYNDFWINDSNYSDAATFKTAMNGVYLDYALAAPEVYDLVEPIVTTGEAGETEARISPNVDGISAPMLCDITYGKGNEAAIGQSQYAMVAGHLLNTHKIWGRDFDGTQDVAGALTGVTSITMNGALSGVTTLGVSGAATLGSTLSVAGNTTLSGTLGVSGLASLAGGLKLTTTKKIWFDDTHYIELLNGELHTNLPIVSDSYITAGAAND